jgi:hypothetical protein
LLSAEFCPELSDPIGGTQMCKDWGSGGQFKVCEIACNAGLRFSQQVPKFYTCGAEGFWRPTSSPNLPLVYPACTGKYEHLVNKVPILSFLAQCTVFKLSQMNTLKILYHII